MILVVGMKRRAGAFSLPRHPRRMTYCVRCIRLGSRSMRGRPRRAETPSSAERKVDDLNASSSFWQERLSTDRAGRSLPRRLPGLAQAVVKALAPGEIAGMV